MEKWNIGKMEMPMTPVFHYSNEQKPIKKTILSDLLNIILNFFWLY